jgi:multiple sugar transport system substrate-binding protein
LRRRAVVGALLVALTLPACEADVGPTPEPDESPTTTAATDHTLEFGVFGSQDELDAYASLVGVYNSLYDGAEMDMTGYAGREELMGEIRETGEVPDVFLASGRDLAWLREEQLLEPVDSMLLERGVDLGDLYARDAVLAFSADSRLQCMPVGVSPTVMFYNTELVDFERMLARGLPAPVEEPLTWNYEQWVAAVEFASRPRRVTRGIAVDPSLRGLAPFVYAAGGEVFDDPETPTSLAFSDDATRSALGTVLEVLRDPRLTLSPKQLERRSAMEWFKSGKLGMIPGTREQVPMLREVDELSFDVLPIPAIERNATTGTFTGMCVSRDTGNLTAAADFLVHMTSPVSVRRLVSSGSLVPANLEVALSDDFLQPGREPQHAQVFTNSIRQVVLPPLLESWSDLEAAVHSDIMTMFVAPVITDLEPLTQRIDEDSRTVLAPDPEETEGTETETP